jgi:hypothetical protein
MSRYDPDKLPNKAWLAMDEAERITSIEAFHKRAGIQLPDHTIHAVIHSIIEAQVAEGDALPVAATLRRLMAEGLNRHDAIHAIGALLAQTIHQLLGPKPQADKANQAYLDDVKSLTAKQWLAMNHE